jgi:hypothetical protein
MHRFMRIIHKLLPINLAFLLDGLEYGNYPLPSHLNSLCQQIEFSVHIIFFLLPITGCLACCILQETLIIMILYTSLEVAYSWYG